MCIPKIFAPSSTHSHKCKYTSTLASRASSHSRSAHEGPQSCYCQPDSNHASKPCLGCSALGSTSGQFATPSLGVTIPPLPHYQRLWTRGRPQLLRPTSRMAGGRSFGQDCTITVRGVVPGLLRPPAKMVRGRGRRATSGRGEIMQQLLAQPCFLPLLPPWLFVVRRDR